MTYLKQVLELLIDREEEEKQKARDNWTISEYAYHDGKLNAYRELINEVSKSCINCEFYNCTK